MNLPYKNIDSKYLYLMGKFWPGYGFQATGIWAGGTKRMPYWCNPDNSRDLTDEELEKYYEHIIKKENKI